MVADAQKWPLGRNEVTQNNTLMVRNYLIYKRMTFLRQNHAENRKGKQASSRKFRRRANVLLHQGKHHLLPLKSFEVMSPWDLGGDGKAFFGFHPEEEWYVNLMRK